MNFRLIMFSDKSANDGRRARYKIFQLAKRFVTHSPSVIRDFRKRKYICFAGADDTSLPEGGFDLGVRSPEEIIVSVYCSFTTV